MAIQVQQLGGEVTVIEAALDTTIDAFKDLIYQALRPDDDWLTRKVTQIDVMLGARLLEGSQTLAQSGVSHDVAVLAVFSQRCVECESQGSAAYDLTDESRHVVVRVPEGTTELAPHAFSHCVSIQRLILPSSLTSIGKTFPGCHSLCSLRIPDSVTRIGDYAFYDCGSLKELTIPSSVTTIGRMAFAHCRSLRSLTIPTSVTGIGAGAFLGCRSLMSLSLPPSVSLARVFQGLPSTCETSLLEETPRNAMKCHEMSEEASLLCASVPGAAEMRSSSRDAFTAGGCRYAPGGPPSGGCGDYAALDGFDPEGDDSASAIGLGNFMRLHINERDLDFFETFSDAYKRLQASRHIRNLSWGPAVRE